MVSKRVAVVGDRTTTGGQIITGDSRLTSGGIPAALLGCTAYCPKCNSVGTIIEGAGNWTVCGTPVAYDGCLVACGCTLGTNRLIATRSLMFTNVTSVVTLPVRRTSPVKPVTSFNSGARSAPLQNNLTEAASQTSHVPAQTAKVFAKSCTVGYGCSDAAKEQEPSTNFGTMLIYGIASAFTSPAKAQHPSMLPYSGNSENSTYPVNGGVIGGTPVPVVVPTPAGPMVAFAPTPIVSYPSPNINIPTLLDNPKAAFFVSSALLDSANSGKSFTSALMGVMIAELFGDDVQYDEEELRDLANIQGHAKTRARFFFEKNQEGQLVAHGLHSVEGTRYEHVRVREMKWNSSHQHYEFIQQGQSKPTIIWTPANPGGKNAPTHTGHPVGEFKQPTIFANPIHDFDKGATKTELPILNLKDFNDYILVFPADSGIPPLYVYFSKPYGETTAKGRYSGRDFNPDKAGGEILDLDWRTAEITQEGIEQVKIHSTRFGNKDDNAVMIERLEKIVQGELTATDIDKRFYTHEIRELERYRNLGIADGTVPTDEATKIAVWNNTHTATLEDYKIHEKTQSLYTPEAKAAGEKQEWRENK